MGTEVFSVWSYLADELTERGWSKADLATRMSGDANKNFLALTYLEQFPFDAQFTIGDDVALRLAHAFGTSQALWLNLDKAARQHAATQEADEDNERPAAEHSTPITPRQ